MYNVFIDGKEGTTGLQIYDRLGKRSDINIITLPEELRKDKKARAEALNSADICFLCLPDDAAKESVSLITNPKVKVIDASTAHRTNPDWVYGFPELSQKRREEIASSNRVANPGCHATGFISIVAPLVKSGLLSPDYPFVANSITGYSGAGKKTIAVYESEQRDIDLDSPREYALGQTHKHLPEMVRECGLSQAPIFNPIICDFYCGMCVSVPVFSKYFNKKYSLNDVREMFAEYYACQNFISVPNFDQIPAFLPANELSNTNKLKIYVAGNDDRILISSVFDNLGKGASGAAVQNMNIMLGINECESLL
jgi:N-acetyl-gamma-glutamyl-phosphate reductase